MKLECIRDKIRHGLNQVERITGRNPSLPILSTVLIETEGKTVVLKSTNLELGIKVSIPCKVEEAGRVAVSAQTLSSTVSSIDPGSQTLKVGTVGDNLYVSTSKASTLIKTQPHQEFPPIPQVEAKETLAFSSRQLVNGLKRVVYAASASDIKPEISSVYLYSDNDQVFFVATDSFRLAEYKLPTKKALNLSPAIIPVRNTNEIIRALDQLDEDLLLNNDKNQISLTSPGVYLVSRLVNGVYPDYKAIVPKERKTKISIDKDELAAALRLANVFADKLGRIDLRIKPQEGLIELTSKSQDVGENVTRLAGPADGEDVEIAFNGRYLIDCLQSIDAPSVDILINSVTQPLVVTGSNDQQFTYLIMPMSR